MTGDGTAAGDTHSGKDAVLFALLLVDTVLLAVLELFFLPLRFGAAPIPITVLLALVTTPLLVRTSARLVGARPATVPLLLWLVSLLVFGVLGPGGDHVLITDWRMLLLLLCGALPAAAVLGRASGGANARG